MRLSKKYVKELIEIYPNARSEIQSRLDGFSRLWKEGREREIFSELVFCLLTPQSRARSCWNAVKILQKKNILLNGTSRQIARELHGVRFHNNKAGYIVEARKQFSKRGKISIKNKISHFGDSREARMWLVKNVKGLGYKEASHFLRNIGFGVDLAILDRHILKNLKILGIVNEIPNSLTKKRYLEIESGMAELSQENKIPMAHLDLLLWYKETGEVFK